MSSERQKKKKIKKKNGYFSFSFFGIFVFIFFRIPFDSILFFFHSSYFSLTFLFHLFLCFLGDLFSVDFLHLVGSLVLYLMWQIKINLESELSINVTKYTNKAFIHSHKNMPQSIVTNNFTQRDILIIYGKWSIWSPEKKCLQSNAF